MYAGVKLLAFVMLVTARTLSSCLTMVLIIRPLTKHVVLEVLSTPILSTLPSYTSISDASVGNTIYI
jgi:hypothetical protein